jgi:hypothetical protein
MRAARELLVASLLAVALAVPPVTSAYALLVKVSVDFGPTVTEPDDGRLVVTADPGDLLAVRLPST